MVMSQTRWYSSPAGLARSQPQGPERGGEETREDQSGLRPNPAPTTGLLPTHLCRVEGLEARERLLVGVVGAEGDIQAGARW